MATTPPSRQATSSSWTASVPGLERHVPITAIQGDAARLGWDITSGTALRADDQTNDRTADHIGGSARVLPDLLHHSA
jgi:hypothetical protein